MGSVFTHFLSWRKNWPVEEGVMRRQCTLESQNKKGDENQVAVPFDWW
jgi:hypothetical protein